MQKNSTFRPIRAVLDTNIVIDLLHFFDERTHALNQAIANGRLKCFCDERCLAELERVVAYPHFGLEVSARQALMNKYIEIITLCQNCGEPSLTLPRCQDADDQKFLELAARCQADVLVTRDKMLLKLDRPRSRKTPFTIVTADAVERLFQLSAENPA